MKKEQEGHKMIQQDEKASSFIKISLNRKQSQILYLKKPSVSQHHHLKVKYYPSKQQEEDSKLIDQLLKFSVNYYGSINRETSEMNNNKFYILDAKKQEEVYKVDFFKYIQAYQANTAYQIKKALEFKKNDLQFRSRVINYVKQVQQDLKEQYSRENNSILRDKNLKIYLQNCPQGTFYCCFLYNGQFFQTIYNLQQFFLRFDYLNRLQS